jgi:serine/threonine-protein kinase
MEGMAVPEPGLLVTPNIRLVEPLRRGAMGSVWVAKNLALDAEVAVKFVCFDSEGPDPVRLERFRREARAAARIKSPHVVEVKDYGALDDNTPFIVMELLGGETLADRLAREGTIPPRLAAVLVSQVAQVLSVAHAEGIVHRDLKPANLFLLQSPYDIFVKVLDFGIAKNAAEGSALTGAGVVLGTAEYMSLEQVEGDDVDYRSDLWSLAIVAYRCLTGRLPFSGKSVGAVFVAITLGDYRPPSSLCEALPLKLDAWFARALAPQREARFQSAKAMADDLRRIVAPSEQASGVAT